MKAYGIGIGILWYKMLYGMEKTKEEETRALLGVQCQEIHISRPHPDGAGALSIALRWAPFLTCILHISASFRHSELGHLFFFCLSANSSKLLSSHSFHTTLVKPLPSFVLTPLNIQLTSSNTHDVKRATLYLPEHSLVSREPLQASRTMYIGS